MATTAQQPLAPGMRLESYEIQSVIGTGGFGITYRAFDHSLHTLVAIKEYFPSGLAARSEDRTTLSPRTEGTSGQYTYGLQRFLTEARTLAQFHEASIVRVTRFLEAHGTAYLVMDYEQGQSLDQVLERIGRLNEQQAKAVAVHILRGLKAVHAKSYLHRDIKPPNVFVRRKGPPVLLDFGAARLAFEAQRGDVTIMLTPGYAPIEQYGAEGNIGPWTDLYGLGATLLHCITGDPPVSATQRFETIHAGSRDPINARLDTLTGEYSQPFLEALRWMLDPYAAARPPTAEDALQVLGGQRSAPPPPSRPMAPATMAPGTAAAPTEFGPAPEAAPPASGGPRLEQSLLARAEAHLAEHLGPIASVLVERAGARAGSAQELYRLLAEELEDPTERAEFLSGAPKGT